MRALLVAALALAVTASSGASLNGTPTSAPPLVESCLPAVDTHTVVRFRASDGTRLVGVVLGKGSTGVVLAHRYLGDLCEWLPYARTLARRGYRVLAIDLRGFGSSGHPVRVADEAHGERDVVAAVAQLRRRGAQRVLAMGSSLGATVVLAAASRVSPPLAGVVSLSGGATPDALAAMRRSRVPTLFMAAKLDARFPRDARTLYRAARATDKRLVIVSGAAHGSSLLDVARNEAIVARFLRQHSA